MELKEQILHRAGIDSGGTFTDIAWIEDGKLRTAKVPSQSHAPEQSVLAVLDKLNSPPELVCHGTTVGTNAILAHRGGPSKMVVTSGFRDVLAIGRGERLNLYSISPERHTPLLADSDIYEIDLRIDSSGNLINIPTEEYIVNLSEKIKNSGAKAVSVGIIHSSAHPDSEVDLAIKLQSLTGLPVFASSRLAASAREYERWSLAAMAGYLSPVLGQYFANLNHACSSPLTFMASSGGLVPPEQVLDNPPVCVLSGPAGGALAAMSLGLERVLALDMGGTSTDVTLLAGSLPRTRGTEIDGLPLPLPTIDIHTIGAGGGSIVKIDTGGMLALGPESAGASPGPACYGNDGPATLSDIALLAGRLIPDRFLGGEMNLDRNRSIQAIRKVISNRMAIDEMLDGVIELALVNLTGALRKISIGRGIDPAIPDAMFTLVPFGGAGALFAVECARMLGLNQIVHPRAAGVFSALGLLKAPISCEHERTILKSVNESIESVLSSQEELVKKINESLEGWCVETVPVLSTTIECRYRGQTHTLEVPLDGEINAVRIRDTFESAYRTRYTYLHTAAEIEVVSIRLRGEIPAPHVEFPDISPVGRDIDLARAGTSNLRLDGSWTTIPVLSRDQVPVETAIMGPALIIEDFATLYLPPDSVMHLDKKGHAIIEI